MKFKIIISIQLILYSFCFGQNYDPFIEGIINQANLDSLVSYVRVLSGEDSVVISDSTVLITTRVNYLGNDLAADYIKSKLEYYGLETYDQRYSATGRNVYSIQRGTTYPEKYLICCAHYDAVTSYGADDNASGVAGVLEAARILSNYQFEFSIIYALWDEEEIGLLGSKFYAAQSDSNDMDIKGVLNFDMLAWDSNDDGLFDIHTRDIANSVPLSNFLVTIDSLYSLPIKPVICNPGTSASDHSPFWQHNYSANLIIEGYWSGDFNPYYHTSEDRIDKFNLPYFYNVVKLGIASVATLATEDFIESVQENVNMQYSISMNNFPNPFNNSTIIQYSIPEGSNISLDLYSNIGEKITNLTTGYKMAGKYEVHFDGSTITSGVYFIVLKTTESICTHKILLLK